LKNGGIGYFDLATAEASLQIADVIKGFSRCPTNYNIVNYEEFIRKLRFPIPPNPRVKWYKLALFRFEELKKPETISNKKLHVKYVDLKEDVTYPNV